MKKTILAIALLALVGCASTGSMPVREVAKADCRSDEIEFNGRCSSPWAIQHTIF